MKAKTCEAALELAECYSTLSCDEVDAYEEGIKHYAKTREFTSAPCLTEALEEVKCP